MHALADHLLVVEKPLVHDESRAALWRIPGFGGLSSDRGVRFRGFDRSTTDSVDNDGKVVTYQGGMNYDQSLNFIEYRELGVLDLFESQVGLVSVCGETDYLQWINSHYQTEVACN